MLSTTLDLQANPFVNVLRTVDRAVGAFSAKLNTLTGGFTGLQSAAQTVSAVFDRFRSTLDLGGTLTDQSAATGEAAGELLVLRTMFQNAGKDANATSGFIAKLHKAIGGFNEEGTSTRQAFDALGTSAEELRGLPVTAVVQRLTEGFAGIENASDRGQVAMRLFGKSGQDLLAIFRDPEALALARTQVGGLAGTMDRLAPTLDLIGDAVTGITLKFQQFTAGALQIVAPEAAGLAEALNRLDLTSLGRAAGYVALAVIRVGEALKVLVPIVVSLGVGWAGSAAVTALAGVRIVATMRAVTLATVTGMRAIYAAIGPVGLLIAGLTYLWMKFHDAAGDPIKAGEAAAGAGAKQSSSPFVNGIGVSSLTARGLDAYTGGMSMPTDPVVSRQDETNRLLREVRDAVRLNNKTDKPGPRPDLKV